MKKLIVLSILFAFISVSKTKADNYGNDLNFNYFYSSLAPYGEWIELDYKLYAWRPLYVNYNWQPYSLGRWSWTEYGWYWESYEPFGWATYHYGRWFYDDYYGWIWIPDDQWGPAWVEWRYNNDYIGWSPLPPYAGFDINVGLHFSVGWRSNYKYWHFVRYNNFCNNNVSYYFVNNRYNYKIYSRTKYRTNYYAFHGRIINGGIDRRTVERYGRIRVPERRLRNVNSLRKYSNYRNYNSREVRVFRPDKQSFGNYGSGSPAKFRKDNFRSTLKKDRVVISNRNRVTPEIENSGNIYRRNNTSTGYRSHNSGWELRKKSRRLNYNRLSSNNRNGVLQNKREAIKTRKPGDNYAGKNVRLNRENIRRNTNTTETRSENSYNNKLAKQTGKSGTKVVRRRRVPSSNGSKNSLRAKRNNRRFR